MELSVHPDPDLMARAAATAIADAIAVSGSGRVSVGLAGGSTPRATYTHLRLEPVEWDRVDLWLSDERWVPWDHEDSNGRMATEVLVEPVATTLHRPRWSVLAEPDDSAAYYEATLRDLHDGRLPDIVLLGMGTDGHTASLFPGTAALIDPPPGRWYVANHVPQLEAWRLTATPWLLQHAEQIIVLVAGEDKAAVLAEVLEGPTGIHPIQLLFEASGQVTVYADASAARQVTGRE